jgi:hypothetical protein
MCVWSAESHGARCSVREAARIFEKVSWSDSVRQVFESDADRTASSKAHANGQKGRVPEAFPTFSMGKLVQTRATENGLCQHAWARPRVRSPLTRRASSCKQRSRRIQGTFPITQAVRLLSRATVVLPARGMQWRPASLHCAARESQGQETVRI